MMTQRLLPGLGLILIVSLGIGCGSSNNSGPPTPHNGALVELPDRKGFLEIVKQAASGKAGRSQIVIHFLDRDRNPMSGAPTAATFKGQASGNKPVALKPMEGGAGGLISEPIADRAEIEGEMTATIDGSPVTVPIMIR